MHFDPTAILIPWFINSVADYMKLVSIRVQLGLIINVALRILIDEIHSHAVNMPIAS
jgi:hypothetical protein